MTAHELWLDILLLIMLYVPAKMIGAIVDSFFEIPIKPKTQRMWKSSDEIVETFYNARKNIFLSGTGNACSKKNTLRILQREEIEELSQFFFKNGAQPFTFNMIEDIRRMESVLETECRHIQDQERIYRNNQLAFARRRGKR